VLLLGQDLAQLDEAARSRLRRRQIGIVLQFGQLVPDLSLLDNVALPLLLDGHGRAAARTAAAEWLDRVGLAADRDVKPAELSGGETQRVAVARALVTGPALVFADEPTGSMDTLGGEHLLDILIGSARDRSTTIVLVTHDNIVAACAEREIRLRDGVVEAESVLR
jgi:putative ABC transport system ATP-binding protein